MNPDARRVQRTFLALTLGTTLSASLVWGINTLFLLDAGLSNAQAFAANAFFTAGMVLFEIPTGVVADSRGRRLSYVLGAVVLALTTLGYVGLWWTGAPFWAWALVSVGIGLGYTFFSGALEAWLVDALRATGAPDELERVFSRAQVASGSAMLVGSVAGGVIAQFSSLGVPFVVRAVLLLVTGAIAAVWMKDLGFAPDRSAGVRRAVVDLTRASVRSGLGNPPVRWLMVSGFFLSGVGFYAFYALQPFLLELYGRRDAYGIAGLAAAAFAGSQILGGLVGPRIRRRVSRRTSLLIAGAGLGAALLAALGANRHFGTAVVLLVTWGLVSAAVAPVRQTYLHDLVPSGQRATVLSFDSLISNAGGVALQPALGRVADLGGYGTSLLVGAGIQLLALPFLALSRRSGGTADRRRTPRTQLPTPPGPATLS
ncbi:MFS transporter [Actinotalea sp.]|uniref:MFS transporter n=1 Tax=Actinotalea sp. TaxID=1872145 RepID=UPI003564F222